MDSGAFQELIISKGLYKRLQGYAVPLEDSIETVIAKLCDWRDEQVAREKSAVAEPSVINFESEFGNPFLKLDPIANSLERERLRNAYMTQVLASIELRNKRAHGGLRIPSPYELQVEAGEAVELFETSRKVCLPIGAQLMGEYQQHRFFAAITAKGIEFHGQLYDNPSKAAVAAKLMVGATQQRAQTNGWQFWKIELPPDSNTWEPIDGLRESQLNASLNRPS